MPKAKLPNGVYACVQGKGWMDAAMVCDWVHTVWGQRPGALLRQPSLLVWDSSHGHLGTDTNSILTEMKTDLAVIPGGLTSVLQPLDLAVQGQCQKTVHAMEGKRWTRVDADMKDRRPSI
jgi:hypothetical protein